MTLSGLETAMRPAVATSEVGVIASAPTDIVARLQRVDGQGLFGFVRRLGLPDDQADDAVQEVFLRLMAQFEAGVPIVNERAWAYRTIYRIAMDQHRFQRRLASLRLRLVDRGERAPTSRDLAERLAVWTEVDQLPTRQRHVIYLRYRSDLTFEDIGETLGITASAARSHASQAMARLRSRLGLYLQEL
jgi:RNA polymerase sigma factor (sigma-70 family)